eukprot:1637823-Pleurochrysis_carterae.AAC.1
MHCAVCDAMWMVYTLTQEARMERTVELLLPRFKAEWGTESLLKALQKLGLEVKAMRYTCNPCLANMIQAVFSGKGQFNGMSRDPE